MSSNSIQQKKKKRVTFGDTDVVFGNDDAHDVQETPSSPSSHSKHSPPHTSATTSVRATKMEDEQASIMSSSLPAKSSLTRLLEQSSSSSSSSTSSNGSGNETGNNPAAAINSQRNYRDIKQRYFQTLGVRQKQLQQQQQQQQQRLPPTRRRSASEATPSDFLTSPQRQQRESQYGIPIPNRDGPSPLAMALERETQLRSASVDSGPSPAQAIPINGASAHVGVQRRSASQDMASTLGVSLSVRKHVRYLGEYGEGLEEEEEFLPPHLIAERERSEFSVYQQKKTRGALRNMQLFEAM